MKLKVRNTVLFAEDYSVLVEWYKRVFKLAILYENTKGYHYTELGIDGQIIVGISPAKEMDHSPNKPKNNSMVLQLEVDDLKSLLKLIENSGGEILFGPDLEKAENFLYAGAKDLEGNELWFIER